VRELLTATRSSAQIEVNGDVDESNVSSIVAALRDDRDGRQRDLRRTGPEAAARSLRAASNGVVARGPDALPYCN